MSESVGRGLRMLGLSPGSPVCVFADTRHRVMTSKLFKSFLDHILYQIIFLIVAFLLNENSREAAKKFFFNGLTTKREGG